MSPEDADFIRRSARDEWDHSYPHFVMPREEFVEWMVRCAEEAEKKRASARG